MIRSPEAIQPLLPICAVVAGNNMTVTSERQQSRRLFLPIEIDHKARGSPEYSSTTELLRQHLCYFGHADVERDMIVQQTGMNGKVYVGGHMVGCMVAHDQEIGRASCRAGVCQYVSISVVAVSVKKTQNS